MRTGNCQCLSDGHCPQTFLLAIVKRAKQVREILNQCRRRRKSNVWPSRIVAIAANHRSRDHQKPKTVATNSMWSVRAEIPRSKPIAVGVDRFPAPREKIPCNVLREFSANPLKILTYCA